MMENVRFYFDFPAKTNNNKQKDRNKWKHLEENVKKLLFGVHVFL